MSIVNLSAGGGIVSDSTVQTGKTAPSSEGVGLSAVRSAVVVDEVNTIDRRLAQLNSLLMCSYGMGQDWLEQMGPTHRDHLMWLASDLAAEIQTSFDGLVSKLRKERANG